ncbi:hypothetical protein ALPR1_08183 [Algoriphagus machipongonensis]|uniref:Outer membrane protein beta-barrel domain-containing protein n=2 Tax=Algoriphagus machipongonensis TaxID=388413 RepID=A3I1C1_9BACT|nr:hypothetical protein ALPR1_08183 [Algoriphagus machipongonensis]
MLCVESLAQNLKYFGQTEIGFLYGRSDELWDGNHENRINFTLMTFNGIQFTENHSIGLTTGLDQYDDISIIPLALGWRSILGKEGKIKYTGGLDIGSGLTWLEKNERNEWSKTWYEGGFLVSPSLGIGLPTKGGKTAFSFSIAYKRQVFSRFHGILSTFGTTTIPNDQLPPEYSSLTEDQFLFRSFVFRAGLMF